MDSHYLLIRAGCPLGHCSHPVMAFHPLIGYPEFPTLWLSQGSKKASPKAQALTPTPWSPLTPKHTHY